MRLGIRTHRPVCALAAVLLLAAPGAAFGLDAVVFIEGGIQGPIESFGSWPGVDDLEGREGSIRVYDYHHLVSRQGGALVQEEIIFAKRYDKASPKLVQALGQNEPLTKVEFKFFRTDVSGGGGQVHYFTILAEDGRIVAIEPICEQGGGVCLERVRIKYTVITFTWEDGTITGQLP